MSSSAFATEREYYAGASTEITSERAVLQGTVFPLAQIEAVALRRVPGDRRPALLMAVVALILAWCVRDLGFIAMGVVGSLFVLMSIVLVLAARPHYVLVLELDTGRRDVLTSSDRAWMTQIAEALERALAERSTAPNP
jgi:hypothetical protein